MVAGLENTKNSIGETKMYCIHCQGNLKSGKTNYVVNRKGYHLIIDDVPALICQQCGQPLFTEKAVDLVQEMIRTLDTRKAELNALPLMG